MGRSVSYRHLLRRTRPGLGSSAPKLSLTHKLGYMEVMKIAFLNPYVGRQHASTIKEVQSRGHEIGLHGGTNHGSWQHGAQSWSHSRLVEEISWGKNALEEISGIITSGFSSPGWNSSPALNAELCRAGFKYSADLHGRGEQIIKKDEETDLTLVRTQLAGEPGGVGYLEWLVATGKTDRAAISHLSQLISKTSKHGFVLYDHPAFTGLRQPTLLEDIIELVLSRGFNILTINEVRERFEQRTSV